MDDMSPDGPSTQPARRFSTVRRVLVVLAVSFILLSGASVVAAEEGNPGRSCPGENPNVGFEKATDNTDAAYNSLDGIARAAQAIGCTSLPG